MLLPNLPILPSDYLTNNFFNLAREKVLQSWISQSCVLLLLKKMTSSLKETHFFLSKISFYPCFGWKYNKVVRQNPYCVRWYPYCIWNFPYRNFNSAYRNFIFSYRNHKMPYFADSSNWRSFQPKVCKLIFMRFSELQNTNIFDKTDNY